MPALDTSVASCSGNVLLAADSLNDHEMRFLMEFITRCRDWADLTESQRDVFQALACLLSAVGRQYDRQDRERLRAAERTTSQALHRELETL